MFVYAANKQLVHDFLFFPLSVRHVFIVVDEAIVIIIARERSRRFCASINCDQMEKRAHNRVFRSIRYSLRTRSIN